MRRIALFGLVFGLAARASAAPDDPLAALSGARAKEIATELASDAMGGRKTGFPSGAKAEERVAALYREAGLAPGGPGGSWFHEFEFGSWEVSTPIALSVGPDAVEYGPGFVDLIHTGEGVVEAEVVFVGYGVSAPALGWDDYAGVDVTGKIVLAIRGLPTSREGEFSQDERMIGRKSSLAREKGAAGFLIAEGKNPVQGTVQERFHRADLPAVWVSQATADEILAPRGRAFADLKKTRDDGQPGHSFATSTTVKLEVHGRIVPKAKGRNVLARIDGADPALAKEAVLVGAHLDHLGTDPLGRVFNGADDNASGTSSVVHLAQTLAKSGWKPKRTVFFAGFAGEEQGLVGSRAMAKAMPFGDLTLVAMVNVDMTGQGTTVVGLAGSEGWPATTRLLRERLGEETWKGLKLGRADPNSDHWPFLERGIPAFFAMTTGDHPNYHQLADDAENLKPECLEAGSRVAGKMLLALADEPTPLAGREGLEERILYEAGRTVLRDLPADLSVFASPAETDARSVVVPLLSDAEPSRLSVDWARLEDWTRSNKSSFVLAKSGADVSNAMRGGRVALLPVVLCDAAVRAYPPVLSTYARLGIRWIAPFEDGDPPPDQLVDEVVEQAVKTKMVMDVTWRRYAEIEAIRKRSKEICLTCVEGWAGSRHRGGIPEDLEDLTKAARTARSLGRPAVLFVETRIPYLVHAARGQPSDPAAAEFVINEPNTSSLRQTLRRVLAEVDPGIREPDHPGRERLRMLLGGALVELFRGVR
jgi:aminopeptidase YwaD